MAGRLVKINNATGRVDKIRSCTVKVVREPGDFFSCFVKRQLVGRDQDIDVAVQSLKNPDLRKRIAWAFCSKDAPLEHFRREFSGYRIDDFWPDHKKRHRRST